MSQAKKKQIAGQQRAIAEHKTKKSMYPEPQDKQFAQKTIDNATNRLNKLTAKKK